MKLTSFKLSEVANDDRLCFGGSFNPIHHGHLLCARAALERSGFGKIVLIPSAVPPLKQSAVDMASGPDRLAMCRLAVDGAVEFAVDDLELHRSGPSYTLDTVRELKSRGWPRVNWLIGSDALQQLPQWHNFAELMREVQFVVMERPGWPVDWQKLQPDLRDLCKNVVEVPQIQISSTVIRQRVAAKTSIDYLTPETVCRFIRERGLYQHVPADPEPASASPSNAS